MTLPPSRGKKSCYKLVTTGCRRIEGQRIDGCLGQRRRPSQRGRIERLGSGRRTDRKTKSELRRTDKASDEAKRKQ